MPKAKGMAGKGGNKRRRGKNDQFGAKRELVIKEEGQEYAQILRMLGNGRLEAYCFDGVKRLAIIRGKMQKKVWMGNGDIVLVSLRDFQDGKCDVIHKFNNDEARQLKLQGELPDNIKINEGEVTVGEADDGEGVEFADMSDSDEEGASGNRVSQQNRRLDLVSDDEKSDLDIDDI